MRFTRNVIATAKSRAVDDHPYGVVLFWFGVFIEKRAKRPKNRDCAARLAVIYVQLYEFEKNYRQTK